MNTIPHSDMQFFLLPRGGAERTKLAHQRHLFPGKILSGATIQPPVRFLNGLTGRPGIERGNGQVHRDPPRLMCMGPGVVVRVRKLVRAIGGGRALSKS